MAFIDRNQQHREPAPDLTEHLPKSRKLVRVDKGVKRGLFKKKKMLSSLMATNRVSCIQVQY